MSIVAKSPRNPFFKRLRASTDIERAARQIAGRMVDRGLTRLQLEDYLDSDAAELLALLGLDCDDLPCRPSRSETAQAKKAYRTFVASIAEEAKRLAQGQALPVQPLDRNLDRLAETLDLALPEKVLLRIGALTTLLPQLNAFIGSRAHLLSHFHDPAGMLSGLLDLSPTKTRALCSPRSRLVQWGFFNWRSMHDLSIDERIAHVLSDEAFDPTELLADKLKRSAPAQLAESDFAHLPDLTRLHRHLDRALTHKAPGVNLLIYGPPGTGKTELARSLSAALDAKLWEVPVSDEDGEMRQGTQRAAAYVLTQKLLRNEERTLLLFDEVEDLFGSGSRGLFRLFGMRDRSRSTGKGWVNEQLESNPIPTLWLCNDIEAIDPAYLRRFDEVVELRAPTRSVRQRIVQRYLPGEVVSDTCRARIADIDRLPPAQVERVGKVLAAMDDASQAERDQAAQRLLENSLRAMGLCDRLPLPVLPSHYDPSQLNADFDLDALADALAAGHGGRTLFYGPPGTGKSAFAHHLGQRLDRPVLVRRASDLLDCYVGETEKRIAAAFRDAEAEDAILLIDEADSFLRDRHGATRSWEVTQVNEMLTQIERFDGLFIASTNLIDGLDAAALRRFDFKVKFDALREPQRLALYQRLCADLGVEPAPQDFAAVARCDRLTPGDFAVVRRQCRHVRNAPAASVLAQRLAQEVALKRESSSRRIGFV